MKNDKHYICTGGCGGVSDMPGVCQAEDCPNHGKSLKECNCTDGGHNTINNEEEIQNLNKSQKAGGFTGIEIVILLAILAAGFGGIALIFKDVAKQPADTSEEESQPAVKEEPKPAVNPFPVKPSEEPVELPKEPVRSSYPQGEPILPKITVAGEWHGRFTVMSPLECKGEEGGWEATLDESAGRISGNFSTDIGVGGSVNGSRVGESASWNVGGGASGVNFKGGISGNTMSGTFTGLICNKNPEKQRSTGTYFGGRIVQ